MSLAAKIAASITSAVPVPLVVPVAVMQSGQKYGPFTASAFGAAYQCWVLQATPLSWPAQGDVMLVDVEYSPDGVTWESEGTASWGPQTADGIWLSFFRGAVAATDVIRFTFRPLQNCSATFSLGAIPKAQGAAIK